MRTILAVLFTLLLVPAAVLGQVASTFSHGPTIPMYVIGFDSSGTASSSFLVAGAGYNFDRNFLPSADGRVRWLTVGLTTFFQVPANAGLSFAVGPHIGTFNNLISVGAIFDMANLGPNQSGLLVGDFGKENVKILLSFSLNFGGGSEPTGLEKVALGRTEKPPPNYYKFW